MSFDYFPGILNYCIYDLEQVEIIELEDGVLHLYAYGKNITTLFFRGHSPENEV